MLLYTISQWNYIFCMKFWSPALPNVKTSAFLREILCSFIWLEFFPHGVKFLFFPHCVNFFQVNPAFQVEKASSIIYDFWQTVWHSVKGGYFNLFSAPGSHKNTDCDSSDSFTSPISTFLCHKYTVWTLVGRLLGVPYWWT